MAIVAEAWSLPGIGTFEKKVGPIPYERLTINPRFNGVGGGALTLKYGYARLKEIVDPDNNVETLIRVFEDGVNTYSFFARSQEVTYETNGDISISGQGIESALEFAKIYPFDWAGSDVFPASETTGVSTFLDTIYGGDNLLANPGFENGLLNEVQGISHDYVSETTLNGAITDTATSLTVTDGSLFPASDFRIVIGNEWIHVTTRTGNSFTGLTRGYLGTTAAAHSDLDPVTGGGWFTLTYSGSTTGRLEWNATPAEIEFELEALGNIIDVAVDGEGTVNVAPWLIEFIDPGEIDNPLMTATITNLDLGNGTQFNIVEKQRGGTGDPAPWTKSYDPNTNFVHGGYNVFNVGSTSKFGDPSHSGDKALGIAPAVPTPQGEDNYPGTQQIVPVEPAGIYQATAWVYPTVNGKFSLVVRDLNEKLIKKVTLDMGAGVWQQLTLVNVTIPVNVNQVIFRVAAENPADAATFWIDDCEFNEGYEPGTPGRITIDMRTFLTAQSRDTIDWLTFNFDATNDSDAVAWNKDVSMILSVGESWLQIMDKFEQLGYEWNVDWNGSSYQLNLYNPGGLGQTISEPELSATRIQKAFIRKSSPAFNVMLGQGAEGRVDEVLDAGLVTAYGRREGYLANGDFTDGQMLLDALNHDLDKKKEQKNTAKLTINSLKLGIDFNVGDMITTDIPEQIPVGTYRIQAALVVVDNKGNVSRTVDIGKYVHREVYGGTTSSVTSDAVNWLLRQKRKIQRLEKITADIVNAVPDPQEYTTGGTFSPPVIVAAANAPQKWKDVATVQCTGTSSGSPGTDAADIETAYQTYRNVQLSPGDFWIVATARVTPTSNAGIELDRAGWLRGAGAGVLAANEITTLHLSNSLSGDTDIIRTRDDHVEISDIQFKDAGSGTGNNAIHDLDSYTKILRCNFSMQDGVGIRISGSYGVIRDCVFATTTHEGCIRVNGAGYYLIEGNRFGATSSATNGMICAENNANNTFGLKIIGNHFIGNTRGIFISGGSNPIFEECFIIGNTFASMTTEAIRIDRARGMVIANNVLNNTNSFGTGLAAIYLAGTGDASQKGSTIIGNRINLTETDGIYVKDLQHVSIVGNHLYLVWKHQIRIDGCDQGLISGNYADPDGNAVSPSDGILLEGDTNEFLITGNKLVPDIDGVSSRYGVNISAATCDNNVVVHNDLRPGADWATATLNNAGTGTSTDATPADATAGDNWT